MSEQVPTNNFQPWERRKIIQAHAEPVTLLVQAAKEITKETILPYIELKNLFISVAQDKRPKFEKAFRKYYGMNSAGLSQEFFDAFFKIMHEFKKGESPPNGKALLENLYKIKRKKGDHSMQYSFVSKMLNLLDEDHPIIDKHVKNILKIKPLLKGSNEEKLKWYEETVRKIRDEYAIFLEVPAIRAALGELERRIPEIRPLSSTRKLDFLLFYVGKSL